MGAYIGTEIVNSGLVLHLDAANPKSYPGTGTTWGDLSGNNNYGTLTNGPTFSTANNGSCVFDGVNDYARINNFSNDLGPSLSICCWVNPVTMTVSQSGGEYLNWIINKRNTTTPNTNSWQLITANSKIRFDMWGISNTVVSPSGLAQATGEFTLQLNEWQYICVSTSKSNGGSFNTYYNSQLNFSGTLTGDYGNTTKPIDIGKTGWGAGFYWNGSVSDIQIYDRALSAQEISQNFEATRGRYGI